MQLRVISTSTSRQPSSSTLLSIYLHSDSVSFSEQRRPRYFTRYFTFKAAPSIAETAKSRHSVHDHHLQISGLHRRSLTQPSLYPTPPNHTRPQPQNCRREPILATQASVCLVLKLSRVSLASAVVMSPAYLRLLQQGRSLRVGHPKHTRPRDTHHKKSHRRRLHQLQSARRTIHNSPTRHRTLLHQ